MINNYQLIGAGTLDRNRMTEKKTILPNIKHHNTGKTLDDLIVCPAYHDVEGRYVLLCFSYSLSLQLIVQALSNQAVQLFCLKLRKCGR